MRISHSVALLCALCASGMAWGDEATGVDIDISRNGVIETIASPEKLAEMLLGIAERSQESSQENPADHWDEVFSQPNWIRASFVPNKEVRIAAGNPDAATKISEILVLFPTSSKGRRWPDFVLLRTEVGILSVAKWSVCTMNDLVAEANFDLKDEAEPYSQYRDYCVRAPLTVRGLPRVRLGRKASAWPVSVLNFRFLPAPRASALRCYPATPKTS